MGDKVWAEADKLVSAAIRGAAHGNVVGKVAFTCHQIMFPPRVTLYQLTTQCQIFLDTMVDTINTCKYGLVVACMLIQFACG
jgi:hypothetical protein